MIWLSLYVIFKSRTARTLIWRTFSTWIPFSCDISESYQSGSIPVDYCSVLKLLCLCGFDATWINTGVKILGLVVEETVYLLALWPRFRWWCLCQYCSHILRIFPTESIQNVNWLNLKLNLNWALVFFRHFNLTIIYRLNNLPWPRY